MMSSTVLGCVIFIFLFTPLSTRLCPKPSNTSEIHFSGDNYNEGEVAVVYSCKHRSATFDCCTQGYRTIQWSSQSTASGLWLPIQEETDVRFAENHQQLLLLESKTTDPHMYRCIATGYHPKNIIQKVLRLQIEKCGERGHPRFLDGSNRTVRSQEGDSLNVSCVVFTDGCNKSCEVYWFKVMIFSDGSRGLPEYITEGSHNTTPRVSFAKDPCSDEISSTRLEIARVEAADFEWSYACAATCLDGPHPWFQITRIDKTVEWIYLYMLLLILIATILLLILGLIFKVEIQIRWKTRSCRRKTVAEDHNYDVCLLSVTDDYEDRKLADMLYHYLSTDLKFTVFGDRDILYGEASMSKYANILSEQPILVVVVSKSLLEDHEMILCVRDAINAGQKTIYVKREAVNDNTSDVKDICVAMRNSYRVDWGSEISRTPKIFCHREAKDDFKRKLLQLYILKLLEKDRKKTVSFASTIHCFKSGSDRHIVQVDDNVDII